MELGPLQPLAVAVILAAPVNKLLQLTTPEEEIVPASGVMPQLYPVASDALAVNVSVSPPTQRVVSPLMDGLPTVDVTLTSFDPNAVLPLQPVAVTFIVAVPEKPAFQVT